MKTNELRELDAWIAENVMGWRWYCAIGKAYLFPPWAFERLNNFSVHWTAGIHEKGWTRQQAKREPCKKLLTGSNIEGIGDDIEFPKYSTDPAAAMDVLKKCFDKTGQIEVFRTQIHPFKFGVVGKWLPSADYECEAETLELAICLFAKKIFTK